MWIRWEERSCLSLIRLGEWSSHLNFISFWDFSRQREIPKQFTSDWYSLMRTASLKSLNGNIIQSELLSVGMWIPIKIDAHLISHRCQCQSSSVRFVKMFLHRSLPPFLPFSIFFYIQMYYSQNETKLSVENNWNKHVELRRLTTVC